MRPAPLVTRLVGLWILAGATLKVLYGTPVDLPQLLQDLPLKLGLTFKLALTVEFLVGAFALLRPSKGWLPALLLTGAFLVVLISQVAAGAKSCGCFGAALTISPVVMLVIDAVSCLLLLVTRPWRAAAPDRSEAPWIAVAVILVSLGALPWLLDREKQPTDAGPGWTAFDVPSWKGKRLSDTPIWPLLSEDQRIQDGLIVIWRATCETCAEHLDNLSYTELGDRTVVLVEAPPFGAEKEADPVVERKPEGPWVKSSRLPEGREWVFPGPGHVVVKDGIVVVAVEGHDSLELDD